MVKPRSTGAIKPEEPTYETEKPLEPAPVAPNYEMSQLHR